MLKFVGWRLLRLILTLLAVSFLTFWLGSLLPGDPINAILPPDAPRDQATVERITEELGLDDPFFQRFGRWLGDAATGDLGFSYVTDQSVWGTIEPRIPVTGELAVLATLLALMMAIPIGILGGYREGKPSDKLGSAGVTVGLSVPSFIVGIFLIWLLTVRTPPEAEGSLILGWLVVAAIGAAAIYGLRQVGELPDAAGLAIRIAIAVVPFFVLPLVVDSSRALVLAVVAGLALLLVLREATEGDLQSKVLSWVFMAAFGTVLVKIFTSNSGLPSTGWNRISEEGLWENLRTAILPAFALSLAPLAYYARLLRTDMIATLKEDFVLSARAKGLTDRYILSRHALRPSSMSLVTIVGIQIGVLLGGTVVIEQIFALPGLGNRLLSAINQRDFPMVQGITVFIATVYVVINTIVDFLYIAIDPRIRRR